ncbi:MAG TPA: D-aminoacyl-tRNA deacylase [Terriglobia bacterium]|nr:D-aminoacyl-tRNA deacylase [Terriglobia bacterium]
MRAVVQRVSRAEVRVEGVVKGRIGPGLLVLVAVGAADTREAGAKLAARIVNLRVFDNQAGRMDRSLAEVRGEILCVSEFTLYGDCRCGRRPSYVGAASPETAQPLFEAFVDSLRASAAAFGGKVETGQFRAMMEVESVNDGPVTLLLDSEQDF